MTTDERMPFMQHLEELRRRLIICAIAIAIGFGICYFFKERIFDVLMSPLIEALPPEQGKKLIYTAPHEAFITYLKVAFLAGLGLAVPVILFQFWYFVAPGLYEHEKRYVLPIVFLSSLFFLGGALFGYFIVFPYGFDFFVSFADDFITPMISTREYLSFAVRLLLAFGIIFELPILTFFLTKLGLVTSTFLRRWRKYAIVLVFAIAAALTPPDVFTQSLMALPLIVLYEASVWIAHIFGRKETEGEAEEEQTQTTS